jgi:hypothetical protein
MVRRPGKQVASKLNAKLRMRRWRLGARGRYAHTREEEFLVFYRRPALAKAVRDPSLRHRRGVRRRARPDTAATRVDRRRHGRCCVATTRAARGARGVGEEGGATQGGPTTHGPMDQGWPRRAGPAKPRGGDARCWHAFWSVELWQVALKF